MLKIMSSFSSWCPLNTSLFTTNTYSVVHIWLGVVVYLMWNRRSTDLNRHNNTYMKSLWCFSNKCWFNLLSHYYPKKSFNSQNDQPLGLPFIVIEWHERGTKLYYVDVGWNWTNVEQWLIKLNGRKPSMLHILLQLLHVNISTLMRNHIEFTCWIFCSNTSPYTEKFIDRWLNQGI